jgi:arylsulfatase A
MKRTFQLAFTLLVATVVAAPAAPSAKPNVIVVMADDLGIGDISPTNPDCQIRTPQLQKMAAEGLTFLDAHTPSSVCTPTRYGLLTGRYNWRSRLARGVLSGTSAHLIPADRPTLGHLMRKAGYHTSMIGKWHLGWDWHKSGKKIDFTKPVKNGPDINGFDQYYGHCGSLDMAPYVWVDTGRITAQPDREEGVTKQEDRYGWYRKGPIGADFHIADVLPHLFDKTIERVKERSAAAKSGKPFFIYLPLPAPHTPIVPVPPFKGASKINPYADFVMQMDHHMGELLASLKEAGLDQNTLVIFTSDNGCSPEANFELLKEHGHSPSARYRGHKADIYEGGHRVPFIARWPGQIRGGQSTKALACLTDVYTTLEAITGQQRNPLGGEDGFNLLPVFQGGQTSGRDSLISHSIGGSFAIRQGHWKLCLSAGSGGWSAPRERDAKKLGLPPLQLFNLADDPGEKANLAKAQPKQVKALLALLDEQVRSGRSTPGKNVSNDRDVKFLPAGVTLPKAVAKTASTKSYSIGLSMYSLRQLFFSGELHAFDYPAFAKKTFGITKIDVWDGGFPKDRKTDPTFYQELRQRADQAGSEIFLVMAGAIDAQGKTPEDRKAQAEKFHAPVDNAVTLGARFVRIFLKAPDGERDPVLEKCAQTIKPLAVYAKKKGIIIVIEPGASEWAKQGDFLADLAQRVKHPNLRLMPDFGKMKNHDPYAGTKAMMPYADGVSAKSHDFDNDGNCIEFDYSRLMKTVVDSGFKGIVAIEYEGKQLPPVEGVKATQKLLQRFQDR